MNEMRIILGPLPEAMIKLTVFLACGALLAAGLTLSLKRETVAERVMGCTTAVFGVAAGLFAVTSPIVCWFSAFR